MLKEDHRAGYFTDCHVQSGVCEAKFCNITVFVLNGIIIVQI